MSWAAIILLVCWFGWGYPFIMRAPHRQKRPSISEPKITIIGAAFQGCAIFLAWAFRLPDEPEMGRVALSLVFGPIGVVLAWYAVRHLGKHWRLQAGLYSDHELIRTGPYSVVRHPVYASLLAILLSTLLLLTRWPWNAASLILYVIGTEVRIWAEDRLLASRFGEEFATYRRNVPAYLPFIR
jgi:protein-S-isoprenylcysteine O-methyltransferase Ste14